MVDDVPAAAVWSLVVRPQQDEDNDPRAVQRGGARVECPQRATATTTRRTAILSIFSRRGLQRSGNGSRSFHYVSSTQRYFQRLKKGYVSATEASWERGSAKWLASARKLSYFTLLARSSRGVLHCSHHCGTCSRVTKALSKVYNHRRKAEDSWMGGCLRASIGDERGIGLPEIQSKMTLIGIKSSI